MKNDFDDALHREHPNLFARGATSENIRDGWRPILRRLVERLDGVVRALPEDRRSRVRITEVKQKLGELRVYMTEMTPEIEDVIRGAQREARVTCESCGRPGTPSRTTGPVAVWCGNCRFGAEIGGAG